MSEEADAPRTNPAMTALVLVGALAVVIGGIIGFAANHQLAFDTDVNDFAGALGAGSAGGSSAMSADAGWMWAGVVIAILGALCLVGALIVRASRA